MQKMVSVNLVFVFLISIVLFCTLVETTSSQSAYVPPAPSAPSSYEQALAFLRQDKNNELIVHGLALDRRTFFEMFPMDARQYILNVNQNWYWGDGLSASGASPDHTYSSPGSYEVQMFTDVSFRGGASIRIKCKSSIKIDPPSMPDSISTDSIPFPSDGTELQTIPIILINSGGKAVSIRPKIVVAEGGWVSISPIEKIVLPNSECPSTFNLVLDWTKNPINKTYSIEWDKTTIVGAWCLKYFQ